MRSATRRFRQLAALRPGELATLLVAAVAMRIAPLLLRRRGLRGVQALARARTVARGTPPDPHATALGTAHLVGAAASVGWPRPDCLDRSVVLWWLLLRRGVETDIRIGVRRRPDTEALEFHAWVEHGGVVINDARDIRTRFATFERAIVPRGASFT